MTKLHNGVPVYERDVYATDAILEPHPHYARMRDLGPVVWLPKQRVYALPRYTECKAVLRDDAAFISGKGVALNGFINRLSRGTTLNSDGADAQAAAVVDAALTEGSVDGVADVAMALPMAVV
ncbi:MAG: cytochrome P450, partial [Mycolicibacterium sp.]|nr:cytochrome P450 [Mycolicibacterium sp.]